MQSQAAVVLLCGGFGSGKTTGLSMKALQLKIANGTTPGLIISQTYGSLWSVTVPRLMQTIQATFGREMLPKIRDRTGACWLDFGDKRPVYLRSAKNPGTIDGLDVGWVCGDELRHWPRESYNVALGRVRVKCPFPQSAFSSTPAMNFMAEDFYWRRDPARQLIMSPTIENEKNLAPGFIDNLRITYSKRLQKAVLDGEFTILEGAVVEQFDANWTRQDNPWFSDYNAAQHKQRKTYLAVDPGFRRSAWILIHELGPMQWIAFDQVMPDTMTTKQAVNMVNAKGFEIDELWIDPAADSTQSALGLDDMRVIRENIRWRSKTTTNMRCLWTPQFRAIDYGVEKMRTILGDPDNGIPIRLTFSRDLARNEVGKSRGIVKDLSALRYPELKDGRPLQNVPLKDGVTDHACLHGDEQIFVDSNGWTKISDLDNVCDVNVLGVDGFVRSKVIAKTAISAKLFEVEFEAGQDPIVATGDHRFLVWTGPGSCERHAASFSWATVLQMRKVLQSPDWQAQGLFASSCVGCAIERENRSIATHTSFEREHRRQSFGKFEVHGQHRAFVDAYESAPARYGRSKKSSSDMARFAGRNCFPQNTWKKSLANGYVSGLYMPTMWRNISIASTSGRKVLPSKLQSDCTAQASRDSAYRRVSRIKDAGQAETFCAYVPKEHAFLTRAGIVSHNCDAIRYFSVGMWLTSPLRQYDQDLKQTGNQGWRAA